MQGQFDISDVPYKGKGKVFGESIRWINVGDTKNGFVGLEYQPGAALNSGVAVNKQDIKFIAETLINYGYDTKKRLYLLKPPNINESTYGKSFRAGGLETLLDWSKV